MSWSQLPLELRLQILGHVLPDRHKSVPALNPLSFGRPTHQYNVLLHISPEPLLRLHNENPAGSTGRFWRPMPELSVSKEFAANAWSVFRTSTVVVESWLSFLEHRTATLFHAIRQLDFLCPYMNHAWFHTSWSGMDWSTLVVLWANELVFSWMASLQTLWRKDLTQTNLRLTTRLPCRVEYSISFADIGRHGLHYVMERAKHRIACAIDELHATDAFVKDTRLVFADSDQVDHEAVKEQYMALTPA